MAEQGKAIRLPAESRTLLLIAGIAFALRTIEALRRPFHTDERISLAWGALAPRDMLQIVGALDVHPPLLFLLLHALDLVHAPLWVPRMLMVLLGTVCVVMLYSIVRAWASPQAAVVAALCAAVMPVLVFYDTWIRMYVVGDALVLAELLLLSIALVRTDLQPFQRRLLWSGWAAAAALAGYTLYLTWFAALAQVLYVAFLRRDQLLKIVAALGIAIALWSPQMPTLWHQIHIGGTTFQGYKGHEISGLLSLPGQATLVPQLEGAASNVAAAIAWLWLVASLVLALAYSRRSLLPWLGMPALLTFVYGLLTHKLIYLDRYYLLIAYAVAAWTGCAYAFAVERGKQLLRFGIAALLAAVTALGTAYATVPAFYTADWPAVSDALSQGEHSGDVVLAEQGMPFWALPDDKSITAHPHMFIFYASQIPKALHDVQPFKRVWVIAYEPRGIDPDLVLLRELGKRYRLASVHQFNRLLPAEDVVLLLFVR